MTPHEIFINNSYEIFIGQAVQNLLSVVLVYLVFFFPYQIFDSYWTGAEYPLAVPSSNIYASTGIHQNNIYTSLLADEDVVTDFI